MQNTISTVWNNIKTTVQNLLNGMQSGISSAFQGMLSVVGNLVGNIKNTIVNGFNAAKSYITGLASQAYSWGADIINGIVSGIRSMIGSVTSAVSGVASTIRSYLHFSVPDEGPLTDYESWMPDFMAGLAKGITESKGLIEKAISGVSDSMNLSGVLPNMEASLNANVSGNKESGGEVTLNQPIMIDGKVITTVVSRIQYNQGYAKLRNLGTT